MTHQEEARAVFLRECMRVFDGNATALRMFLRQHFGPEFVALLSGEVASFSQVSHDAFALLWATARAEEAVERLRTLPLQERLLYRSARLYPYRYVFLCALFAWLLVSPLMGVVVGVLLTLVVQARRDAGAGRRFQWLTNLGGLILVLVGLFYAVSAELGRWQDRRLLRPRTESGSSDPPSPPAGVAPAKRSLPMLPEQAGTSFAAAACELGWPEACGYLAMIYMWEDGASDWNGLDFSRERAMMLHEQACQGEVALSCHYLGIDKADPTFFCQQAQDRTGIDDAECASINARDPDYDRALSYFLRACELGNGGGCSYATRMLTGGIWPRQREALSASLDPGRAFEIAESACQRGLQAGCVQSGHYYLLGVGVSPDAEEARERFQRACDAAEPVHSGCVPLAMLVWFGVGAPQDPPGALALLSETCDGGLESSCWALGHLYQMGGPLPPDLAASERAYARAREFRSLHPRYVKSTDWPNDYLCTLEELDVVTRWYWERPITACYGIQPMRAP